MTELADIVAAIYGPEPRFRTLQVTGTEWRNHPRLLKAFLRDVPAGAPLLIGTSMEERPEERVDTWRAWVQPPDRTKVQFVVGDETVSAVFHGDTWWSWCPSRGGLTNGGRPYKYHGRGPAEVMISPGGVLPCLHLELLGRTTALSRRVCLLRAMPVVADDFSLHDLGKGADQYDLVVDAERGFLLRVEVRLDGKPFRVLEITELSVDNDLPAETFNPQTLGEGTFVNV